MSTYFVFRGSDRPGAGELRARVRDEHRRYIRSPRVDCRVVAGGPLMEDDGNRMIGTLLVLEAANRAAAMSFLNHDPYMREGLFASIELQRWNWGLGEPRAEHEAALD
jgi:uncharacterized protein YciI